LCMAIYSTTADHDCKWCTAALFHYMITSRRYPTWWLEGKAQVAQWWSQQY